MTDHTRIQGPGNVPRVEPNGQTEAARRSQSGTAKAGNPASPSFAEMLRARQGVTPAPTPAAGGPDALRFSAHAQTRLQSRHIDLQPAHLQRLQSAVARAASKGSRDSLVLLDDMAFVVSVTNRTVVTVADRDSLKQNVFTNIDSAVIA